MAQQELWLLRGGLLLRGIPTCPHTHVAKLVGKQGVLGVAREGDGAELLVHAPV